MANPIVTVPMSTLKPGDTVVLDGVWKTVGRAYLKHCPFMGTSLYGDVRGLHKRTIDVVLFPIWQRGKLAGYARQIL